MNQLVSVLQFFIKQPVYLEKVLKIPNIKIIFTLVQNIIAAKWQGYEDCKIPQYPYKNPHHKTCIQIACVQTLPERLLKG